LRTEGTYTNRTEALRHSWLNFMYYINFVGIVSALKYIIYVVNEHLFFILAFGVVV